MRQDEEGRGNQGKTGPTPPGQAVAVGTILVLSNKEEGLNENKSGSQETSRKGRKPSPSDPARSLPGLRGMFGGQAEAGRPCL
jgi:hypothetical protein